MPIEFDNLTVVRVDVGIGVGNASNGFGGGGGFTGGAAESFLPFSARFTSFAVGRVFLSGERHRWIILARYTVASGSGKAPINFGG